MNPAQQAFWGQKRGNQYYITLPKLHLHYSVFSVGLVTHWFYSPIRNCSIKTLSPINLKNRNFHELWDGLKGFILNVGLRN